MPTEARNKKQRTFYVRLSINFIMFCIVAAPLQFHLQLYAAITAQQSSPQFLERILKSGPIYFYALILCLEAMLRLEHYPNLLFGEIRIYVLRAILLVPMGIFGLQYFVTPYYSDPNLSLPNWEQWIQIGVGLLALVLSSTVHHIVVSQEAKRIR